MDETVDAQLLEKFDREIWDKVPHLNDSMRVVNATPMTDITSQFVQCARSVCKINLDDPEIRVYGKFDSVLPSGSIKVRAAVHIIRNAITSGKIRSGGTVIEATSGNFGIALGLLSGLGIRVIAMVSRKLQEGVFKELRDEKINVMDLDMDVCPAPGMENKADELAAKAAAANIRSQLAGHGFDTAPFDGSLVQIEELLAKQDIINLAILLGRIYGIFCPAQYDNDLNIEAHRTITAPEMDQQLGLDGDSLQDYDIMCAFGTGGTSGGISRYMSEKYGRKAVHVVFPIPNQDVAGIRTKAKTEGLRMYRPDTYEMEHEIDYEKAKFVLKYFVDNGMDIGESTALALYAAMQMASQGGHKKFVVIVADGVGKYRKNFEQISKESTPVQVSLEDACVQEYDRVVWVHPQYAPREEGIEMLARSLGVDKSKITITKANTINRLLSTQQVPDDLSRELEGRKRTLLVCMAGNTSLKTAQMLARNGIVTQSLNGGITDLPEGRDRHPSSYIQVASE